MTEDRDLFRPAEYEPAQSGPAEFGPAEFGPAEFASPEFPPADFPLAEYAPGGNGRGKGEPPASHRAPASHALPAGHALPADHGLPAGHALPAGHELPADHAIHADHALPAAGIDALYQVVAARRDVRNGFRPDPIADDVLTRVLTAAHQAPSVGLSQPWDFIVVRDRAVRERVHQLARRQQDVFAAGLPGPRARAFRDLKVEAILDTPLNIVVTCDVDPRWPPCAGPPRPAAGRDLLDRVRGAEPLARRAGRRPRRGLGQLLRRA